VDAPMNLHVVLEAKRLATDVTLVRLFAGVNDRVTTQLAWITADNFAAWMGAREHFRQQRLVVFVHMPAQHARIEQRLETDFALGASVAFDLRLFDIFLLLHILPGHLCIPFVLRGHWSEPLGCRGSKWIRKLIRILYQGFN